MTLAASLLVGASLPCKAWSIPRNAEQQGHALAVAIDLAEPPTAGTWKSGAITVVGADSISLHLTADFSKLRGFTGFVFDQRGGLVDTIPFGDVAGSSLWTAFSTGSEVFIEISGPGPSDNRILIDEAVTEYPLGAVDVVPDGFPTFENTFDVGHDILSVDDEAATARLIIGQNSFPLEHRLPSKTPDWCTGFLLSPNLLITVSHCFRARPELCQQTVALFGFDVGFPDGILARSCVELVYLNPYIDVAIARLSPVSRATPTTTLATRAPVVGEPLIVLQHPHGSVSLVSRDSSCVVTTARSALKPSRSELDYSLLDALGFTHQCDTLEGSSGSPVFDREGEVIGLHQGGEGQFNNAVRADVIETCISVDVAHEEVRVLKPTEIVCMNTL